MTDRSYISMLTIAVLAISTTARAAEASSILDLLSEDVKTQKVVSATIYYLPYGELRAFGLSAAMLRVSPTQTCDVRFSDKDRRTLEGVLRKADLKFSNKEGHDMHWGADFKDASGAIHDSLFVGVQYPGQNYVAANFNGSFVNINPAIAHWFDERHKDWSCSAFIR